MAQKGLSLMNLVPVTNSIIVATLNYLNHPVNVKTKVKRLRTTSNITDIFIYAHGRDYHKVMKKTSKTRRVY